MSKPRNECCSSTYLDLVRPAGLDRALGVANLLQHASAVLEVLRKQVLLLRDFGQQHAQLVADVRQGVVLGALAPFAELAGDAVGLAAGGLVGADLVVLRLDQLVQLLGQLGLLDAAQRRHAEVVLAARLFALALLRADGEGASDVPGRDIVSAGSFVQFVASLTSLRLTQYLIDCMVLYRSRVISSFSFSDWTLSLKCVARLVANKKEASDTPASYCGTRMPAPWNVGHCPSSSWQGSLSLSFFYR